MIKETKDNFSLVLDEIGKIAGLRSIGIGSLIFRPMVRIFQYPLILAVCI